MNLQGEIMSQFNKKFFFVLIFTVLLSFSYAADKIEKPASNPKIESPSSTLSSPIVSPVKKPKISLDLSKIFFASPIIYSLLTLMSVSSLVIWLYSLATFRMKDLLPDSFLTSIRSHLTSKKYDEAYALSQNQSHFLAKMIFCGLQSRIHGSEVMIDAMKSEGKRASAAVWQRLSLLNDIVVTAPMLGLLGTVIGMFYAFYDVNRSMESITSLFDGLGIAVGTTVAGLIVSIVAMILHTTLKYRLVRSLSLVENEALSLSSLIETKKA